MSLLLDTNVLSELRKGPKADAKVLKWAKANAQRTMPTVDCYLAATALEHNLIIVTRNTSDFTNCGATVVNPWL